MTDSFVTQCPHCRTSFRVSRAQLGAAKGAVRCGACLHVFNATRHLQGEAPAPAARPARAAPAPAATGVATGTAAVPPPGKVTLDNLWIHDDLDLDALDLDEELAKLEHEEQRKRTAPSTTEQVPTSLPEPPVAASAEQPAQHADENAPAPVAAAQDAPAEAQAHSADDDSPAAPTANARTQELPASDNQAGAEPPTSPQAAINNLQQAEQTVLRDRSLFQLSDEPLQLAWQQPRKPWGRWLGWGLLNLLAAAALAGQYITYHFDEVARQDRHRPWFELICPRIGCILPPKVDISLIKSSNLVVRSHPEFSGALVVDAILYNRASFAQPFPLLELRFANLNGQLLASRRFKPSEYLSGELAGQAEMPPQTPIHVALDILDPGADAVNYSLNFLSPE